LHRRHSPGSIAVAGARHHSTIVSAIQLSARQAIRWFSLGALVPGAWSTPTRMPPRVAFAGFPDTPADIAKAEAPVRAAFAARRVQCMTSCPFSWSSARQGTQHRRRGSRPVCGQQNPGSQPKPTYDLEGGSSGTAASPRWNYVLRRDLVIPKYALGDRKVEW